jgi:hypothetical protein
MIEISVFLFGLAVLLSIIALTKFFYIFRTDLDLPSKIYFLGLSEMTMLKGHY